MIPAVQARVFKAGSTTYFNSSLFFPRKMRADVFALYGFVRVADDLVDAIPQDAVGFARFVARYRAARVGTPAEDPIIDDFVALAQRLDFDPAWTDAFLASMEADLTKRIYRTEEEALEYIYGSAEVIGLFMAKIMRLPEESHPAARMLGRAMQFINFIRDVAEDTELGRRYLPLERGGAPLLALDWAQSDERQLLDALLVELLRAPRLDPLQAAAALDRAVKAEKRPAALKRVIEWAQKWLADLALASHAQPPRFFITQAEALRRQAAASESARILAFGRKAIQYKAQCEQPLNSRLLLEDFFLGFAALFRSDARRP